MIGTKMFP